MKTSLKDKTTKVTKKYIFAVGRRKTASARVRLFKGVGENLINNKKVEGVWYERPFKLIEALDKFFFTARVMGGGKESQKEAILHGLARALVKVNTEKYRNPLKKAGLLTRDARERQRRMVGTGGKSRRKKQSPKR